MNDSNTKDNSMINKRVSLFYQVFLECIQPYSLPLYLIESMFSVSRHECTGWLTEQNFDKNQNRCYNNIR